MRRSLGAPHRVKSRTRLAACGSRCQVGGGASRQGASQLPSVPASLPHNDALDNVERLHHLRRGDHERRRQCQHIAHGRLEREPLIECAIEHLLSEAVVRLLRRPVLHELNSEHQATPAHITDCGKSAAHLLQPFYRPRADPGRILDQPLILNDLNGREGRSSRDWVFLMRVVAECPRAGDV